jgi:hypothetical protein
LILFINQDIYNIDIKKQKMKNILKFIDQWGGRISFLMIVIIFLKTCTTNTKIDRVENTLTHQIERVDSTVNMINGKTISTDEMIEIIEETPFWKSLELEELSDKNKIPINKLKNDFKKP